MSTSYAPPSRPSRNPAVAILHALAIVAAHAVVGVVYLLVFLTIVPGYRRLFQEFAAELRGLTVMLFDLLTSITELFYLYVLVLATLDSAIVLGLCFLPRPWNALANVWCCLILVAAILGLGLIAFALYAPLERLFIGLAG